MQSHEEQTLILIKPDALQRNLVGEIIRRFEQKGLKIVGMKMMRLEDALLDAHYAHIADKPFFANIKNFMKSSPVIAMVLSGSGAIEATRIIVGPTKSYEAPAGSIRGDLAMSIQSNMVHASDAPETAKEEVARFFDEDELFSYRKVSDMYIYSDQEF